MCFIVKSKPLLKCSKIISWMRCHFLNERNIMTCNGVLNNGDNVAKSLWLLLVQCKICFIKVFPGFVGIVSSYVEVCIIFWYDILRHNWFYKCNRLFSYIKINEVPNPVGCCLGFDKRNSCIPISKFQKNNSCFGRSIHCMCCTY